MFIQTILAALLPFFSFALAITAPTYSGYTRSWQSTFIGAANLQPNSANWNIIDGGINYNNELQTYTTSTKNVRFSGSSTLQIIPLRDSTAANNWTSARIESKYTVTPTAGKITRVEASLRLAGNAAIHKQGIWPAFWMLGNAYRTGGKWPACGEVDIMEKINGQSASSGTLHCDVSPGGICNEGVGLGSTTAQSDSQYHVWRVEFNRKSTNYKNQSITWSLDGVTFQTITGTQIGNSTVWAAVCQSPFYFILNVAVGGDWPGYPNSATWGGSGSMMEVQYVAHYVST